MKYYRYALIPIMIGLLWIGFTLFEVSLLRRQQSVLSIHLKKTKDSISTETNNLKMIRYLKNDLQIPYLLFLDEKGLAKTLSYRRFSTFLKADSSITLMRRTFRPDTSLRLYYYQKDLDQERVALAFKESGYKVINELTKDFDLMKAETNAVYFNRYVSINDIKLITLILIRAGFDIRIIEQDKISYKNVQIGAYLVIGPDHHFHPTSYPPVPVDLIIHAKNQKEIEHSPVKTSVQKIRLD